MAEVSRNRTYQRTCAALTHGFEDHTYYYLVFLHISIYIINQYITGFSLLLNCTDSAQFCVWVWHVVWHVNLKKGIMNTKAKVKLVKADHPGVFYMIGKRISGGPEKIFYIRYRKTDKSGKRVSIKEKVGRQFEDNMTSAQANRERTRRIEGLELSNKEKNEDIKAAKDAESNKWTVARLWEEYKENKVEYKGVGREESRFRVHIKKPFGEREPQEIIPLDVDRFRNNLLKKKKLAPQTVKNTLELLRRITNYGMNKNLCSGLSFKIEMPANIDNIVDESLNHEQIGKLLHVLNQNQQNIESWLLKVMLYTGRRTGEICALEWSDIDIENQSMILRDTKAGKTEKLPFSDRVKQFFEEMPRFSDKYIFPNTDGSRRTRSNVHAKRFIKQAGIPDNFRPTYSARHTFASLCASNDVRERVLKVLMGHSHKEAKKDITSRYAKVSKERLLQAVNQIADVIDKAYSANETEVAK